jgi:hypothetical protein
MIIELTFGLELRKHWIQEACKYAPSVHIVLSAFKNTHLHSSNSFPESRSMISRDSSIDDDVTSRSMLNKNTFLSMFCLPRKFHGCG